MGANSSRRPNVTSETQTLVHSASAANPPPSVSTAKAPYAYALSNELGWLTEARPAQSVNYEVPNFRTITENYVLSITINKDVMPNVLSENLTINGQTSTMMDSQTWYFSYLAEGSNKFTATKNVGIPDDSSGLRRIEFGDLHKNLRLRYTYKGMVYQFVFKNGCWEESFHPFSSNLSLQPGEWAPGKGQYDEGKNPIRTLEKGKIILESFSVKEWVLHVKTASAMKKFPVGSHVLMIENRSGIIGKYEVISQVNKDRSDPSSRTLQLATGGYADTLSVSLDYLQKFMDAKSWLTGDDSNTNDRVRRGVRDRDFYTHKEWLASGPPRSRLRRLAEAEAGTRN